MTVQRWRFGDDPLTVLRVVEAGGVVAIPTESSYGLAVDPANPRAVQHVFRLKGRPPAKALPVVTASERRLPEGVRLQPGLESRLAALWPAPLTLVLTTDRPLAAAAGGSRLAVRVPAHERLRSLLRVTGPLTATSANLAGEVPAVDADGVGRLLESAGCPALLVDAGELVGGLPSTLVQVDGDTWRVLRQGAMTEQQISSSLERSSTAFVENSADG